MRDHYIFNYILNDANEPEPCEDMAAWEVWFESDERRILRQQTFVSERPHALHQHVTVSTIFLGIDHNSGEGDLPVLWETQTYIDGAVHNTWRYTSRAEAILGHNYAVVWHGGEALD